jgi:hypothetical protein
VHRLISRLGFKAIITTNYDDLIERAWSEGLPPVYQWSSPQLAARVQSGGPLILKAHGDINNPEDIILTREEYASARYNERAREAMRLLFSANACLWLGYGHNDPDLDLLWDECRARLGGARGYGLALRRDVVLQERLRGAGITSTVLTSHQEVALFVRKIAQHVGIPIVFGVELADPGNDNDVALEVLLLLRKYGHVDLWTGIGSSHEVLFEATHDVLKRLRQRIEASDAELLARLAHFGVRSLDGILTTLGPGRPPVKSAVWEPPAVPPRPVMKTGPPHGASPATMLGSRQTLPLHQIVSPSLAQPVRIGYESPASHRARTPGQPAVPRRFLVSDDDSSVTGIASPPKNPPPTHLCVPLEDQLGPPPLAPLEDAVRWIPFTPMPKDTFGSPRDVWRGFVPAVACTIALAVVITAAIKQAGFDVWLRDALWPVDSRVAGIAFAILAGLAFVCAFAVARGRLFRAAGWASLVTSCANAWVSAFASSLLIAEIWSYVQATSVAHASFKEVQLRRLAIEFMFDQHVVWPSATILALAYVLYLKRMCGEE